MVAAERARALWRTERPFVIALAVGALVRVVVQVAFPPGFVFSDGPMYLRLVDDLVPSPDRPVGYGFLLEALSWLTRRIDAITVTQHLLGLLTAVVLYALLRRWQVSARVAMLATLPVLFDEMQLVLEHSVLSDVLFHLLLVLGVAALAWRRRPRPWTTAVGGLLLGLATLVRVVGEPTVLAAVVFVLVVATSWRSRLLHAAVVVVAFLLPLIAYAAWFHHDQGEWALTEGSGRALYMRTTTFVDCSRFEVPSYERRLCPAEPPGQRQDPTWYGWHDRTTVHGLKPPPGVSVDAALKDFALRAIRAQPLDYARTVARDFVLAFAPTRSDAYEYDTAYKWRFAHYVDKVPSPAWEAPAYAAHGGERPATRQPWGDLLAGYGYVVYLAGPLQLLLVLLSAAGLVAPRPRGAPGTRPLLFLTLALALGLILVPDMTAEFVWRYQLPLVAFLPASAALAWTRLRGGPQSGTTATPSTDCPKGGVTRRSKALVQGTTKRS